VLEQQLTFTVQAEAAGQRLDRWLAATLPDHSRSELQRWVKEGLVQVDATVAKASLKLAAGQTVDVRRGTTQPPSQLQAEAIPLEIVYEDADLLVINKTDLADLVGARLEVMARDANAVRGGRPVLFTNCKTGEGVPEVVAWLRDLPTLPRPACQSAQVAI